MIYIDSRRKSDANLQKRYPGAKIIDVTSKAAAPFVQFSPFYPLGDIPVPFSPGYTAKSVEGIWQGLKVFENADIDRDSFENDKMKNLKRTVSKFGMPRGHRKGVEGTELLGYVEARLQIYLPAYRWVLENKLSALVEQLHAESQKGDLVLLDYETNCDVYDTTSPLSHASLIKAFLGGNFPG